MAKLTMTTFVTLDGVMQAPGGPTEDPSGGFAHGGWLVPYADADMGAFMAGVFDRADAFLLGRFTYQLFASHWPRITDPADPIATRLNALPKHVASRTLEKAEWNNSAIVRDPIAEVEALAARYPRELQVHGSAGLARELLARGRVDTLHLLTYPVVLGSGKRLFGSGAPAAFALTASKTTSKGVVIATYERAGQPTYGSFMLDP